MDIAILREKFQAASRWASFWEETAVAIEFRACLAAETQQDDDPLTFAGQVVEAFERSTLPGPTAEFITADLQELIRSRPDLASEAVRHTGLEQRAREEMEAMGRRFDPDRPDHRFILWTLVHIYYQVLVDQMRTNAALGKALRNAFKQKLEDAGAVCWTDLTVAERRLVKTLGKQHLTGEELAKALDLTYSGTFKTTLSTLVRLKILANDKTGYHVITHIRND